MSYDGTDPLPHPRQEKFAKALASGSDLTAAYAKAGYKGAASNARRLRADGAVKARIDALQRAISDKVTEKAAIAIVGLAYTREDAFREAGEVLGLARSMGQAGPAVAAVKLRADLAGIIMGEGANVNPTNEHIGKDLNDEKVVEAIENVKSARLLLFPKPAERKEG
jgi:hypothetical protein